MIARVIETPDVCSKFAVQVGAPEWRSDRSTYGAIQYPGQILQRKLCRIIEGRDPRQCSRRDRLRQRTENSVGDGRNKRTCLGFSVS